MSSSRIAWGLAALVAASLCPLGPLRPLSAQQPPGIFPSRAVQTGLRQVRAFVLADLDGDGHLDAIAGGTYGDDISVLRGSGDGELVPWSVLPAPVEDACYTLSVGDVDGDGDLDLAALFGVSYVSVVMPDRFALYLGDGTGRFGPVSWVPVRSPSNALALTDVDGDGDADAVLLGAHWGIPALGPDSLTVVLSDGTGSFLPPVVHDLVPQDDPLALAIGDVDADGAVDFLAGTTSGLQVLFNDGHGDIRSQVHYTLPLYPGYQTLTTVDLDLDGDLDVVASGTNSTTGATLDVYLGSPGGSLTLSSSIPGVAGQLAPGDVDGDGLPDLVVTAGNTTGVLLRNDGQGGFLSQPQQSWPASGISSYYLGLPELRLADLDEDGHLDLVHGAWGGCMTVLDSDQHGGFLVPQSLDAPTGAHVSLEDMNLDGLPDLVVGADWQFEVHPALASGGFGPPIRSPTAAHDLGHVVAELTGDGIPDVVLTSAATSVLMVLEGDGAGGLSLKKLHQAAFTVNAAPAVVDLDGDARLDVALVTDKGALQVWRGDGLGSFTKLGLYDLGTSLSSVVAADFDADGRADLLVSDEVLDQLTLLRGDGHGGFLSRSIFACEGTPRHAAVADLDQDGHADLVVATQRSCDPARGCVSVLLGDGQGGLTLDGTYPTAGYGSYVACGDVDGDGRTDVLVSGSGPDVELFLGDGAGTLLHADSVCAFGPASEVALADLDADGRTDLLFATNSTPGSIQMCGNLLPDVPACTTEAVYCAAKRNSAGCVPRICSSGSPTFSSGSDDFVVTAEQVVSSQPGIFLWSRSAAAKPFHGGILCVGAPLVRTPVQGSGGVPGVHDCAGSYAFALTQVYMASHGLLPGAQLFGQFWSRDAGFPAPFDVGLTDALQVTILP